MKSPTIKSVLLGDIHPNPYRELSTYPIDREKVATLVKSIDDVGLWPSIIVRGRLNKGGYEQAFGHHRLMAAKEAGKTEISVIVMDLDDEAMLRYMGRENAEDFSTSFLVLLNTWEGVLRFFTNKGEKLSTFEVAAFLGWTRAHPTSKGKVTFDTTADACATAHALIVGKHLVRSDLTGLSTTVARTLVTQAKAKMDFVERSGASPEAKKEAFKAVADGTKETAQMVREDRILKRDVGSTARQNIAKRVNPTGSKLPPYLKDYLRDIAGALKDVLSKDKVSDKLQAVADHVNDIVASDDKMQLERVDLALSHIEKRAAHWRNALTPGKIRDITPVLKRIEGGKDD
jgi:hypothetical protein